MIVLTILRKARNFARRSRFEQAWFLPVWLLLGISRFVILFIPFRRLAPRLGIHSGITVWVPLIDSSQESKALLIARVVQTAARFTPWVSNCFPQAVAARVLLGLYHVPYCIFFGLVRDPVNATMKAHAWVASGKVSITGGLSFDQYTVVGCFVSPRLAAEMGLSTAGF